MTVDEPQVTGSVVPATDPVEQATFEVIDEITGREVIQLLKLLLNHAANGDDVVTSGYAVDASGQRFDTYTVHASRAALDTTDRYGLVIRRHRTFAAAGEQTYELKLVDHEARGETVASPGQRSSRRASPNR